MQIYVSKFITNNYALFSRSITSEFLPYWQKIIRDLIGHCLEISEIVSPVVHNSSPEGNVPAETIRGNSFDTQLISCFYALSKGHI